MRATTIRQRTTQIQQHLRCAAAHGIFALLGVCVLLRSRVKAQVSHHDCIGTPGFRDILQFWQLIFLTATGLAPAQQADVCRV